MRQLSYLKTPRKTLWHWKLSGSSQHYNETLQGFFRSLRKPVLLHWSLVAGSVLASLGSATY